MLVLLVLGLAFSYTMLRRRHEDRARLLPRP
jgi:hypothetical protein